MKTKGSITQLVRKPRPGYILGEDGCLVAFEESALEGLDPRELSVGDWVEYEEMDRREGRRASRIKPLIQRAEE
jgi:cold shock CspA family protein